MMPVASALSERCPISPASSTSISIFSKWDSLSAPVYSLVIVISIKNKMVNGVYFLLGDGMGHIFIQLFGNIGIHTFKHICRAVNTLHGDMRIGIAGSDKNGGSFKAAFIMFSIILITDVSAGKSSDAAIFLGISCDIFQGQARSL